MVSGQIIATSAEVTLNGGLVRELPQNPLNSGFRNYTNLPRWYISLHEWLIFMVNVGRYTIPMDPMGWNPPEIDVV